MAEVFWLGGSPCAGKTTISHIIAQEFGWQVYHIDRHVERYLERVDPDRHPYLSAYRHTGLRDFLLAAPQTQLDNVIGISHEQFEFIVEDLAEFASDRPILVEGANLLASDVVTMIASVEQVMWMVPTETFQLEVYPKRGSWVQDVLRHHYQPEEAVLAFERWMARDAMMAAWTASEARSQDFPVIVVDGKQSLQDNATRVMRHFGLIE